MKTSDTIDKLAPAIIAAHKEMALVGKSGKNKFDNYKYANLQDYYSVCRGVFLAHGISITESVNAYESLDIRKTKTGADNYTTRVLIVLRMTHTSGQWQEIQSLGEGQDRGDKGPYQAITGARKYAIAMAGNLVTSDDPEKDASRAKTHPSVEVQPAAKEPDHTYEGAM